MVPLPLFKLGALFVRQISKYGANYIKSQAHDHPKFRTYAARYGQTIHQINMRMTVKLLKDSAAERRAKEKAEAPTVKTEEQMRHDEEQRQKNAQKEKIAGQESSRSIWKRKFRPLPEAKAVDLFADVIGDTFVLLVAGGLIIYEYVRSKGKPDANAVKIEELNKKLEELDSREKELEEQERKQQIRVETLEQTIEEMRKAGSKKKLLSLSRS
ncbi:uncharacterized protein RAG0_07101 [Rhynchosporium agropyri]|uniref:OPA3-like protein n=1 Tax=Rhynchosporium agropyri TaxID=914238 RepID=A0A1E1KJV4_9HELO|nr:uncharacterized protein RAG0_07101 [Rhynchosporium agropyri]